MSEEIVTVQPDIGTPEELRAQFESLNSKFSKLAQILYGNVDIRFIKSRLIQATINDGVPNKLSHRLEKEASAVILHSGRVQFYTLTVSTVASVTIKPRLANTVSMRNFRSFSNKVEVVDPTIFKIGDEIRIGDDIFARVTNIKGNVLSLSKAVYFTGIISVSLSKDFCQFLIV